MLAPARQKPGRQIADLFIAFDDLLAFACATPQHGVDEADMMRGFAVGLHETHSQIDGGVVGHIEPEDLRGTDEQRAFGARGIGRQSTFEKFSDEMLQRAETAQNRCENPAHQGAVAVAERLQPGMRARTIELLVERTAAAQNSFKDVGGDATRCEARGFGWGQISVAA